MPIAAFFDWDGTLSADGQTVARDTVAAIHALQRAGHSAILCTGRATGLIPDTAKAIGFDGLVAAAGAFVRLGERQLFRRYLPPDRIPALIAHFLADGQTCVLEGEAQMYVVNDAAGRFPESWTHLSSPEEFTARFPGHIVSKLTLHGPMSAATDALLSASYTIIRHPTYAEILPKGCGKAAGMGMVLKALGLGPTDSWAFGDSYNDVDMLAAAGIGVAMGSAPDGVKAYADRITASADHNGVAAALRELLDGQTP